MARPHSTLRERVWDMTIEQLVAQEFDYLCDLVMVLAVAITKVRLVTLPHS